MRCAFFMIPPIGAAFGCPSMLEVETMVSVIMPFEKPKSANFSVKPTPRLWLEDQMPYFCFNRM